MSTPSIQTLADRLDIRDVRARYGIAIDTRDKDLLRTVFAEDVVMDHHDFGAGVGVDWFIDWAWGGIEACKATQHFMGQSLVESLEGDTARCRTYVMAQ